MSNVHVVNIGKNTFDIIVNNKNHCIGVVDGRGEDVDLITLERFSNFFIIKSVGIENIFDNQYLSTHFKRGDYVVLSQEGGYDWLDDIERRTTVLIEEVHHFQSGLDTPSEISISFYEYTLMPPSFFHYEGDSNGQ
jgi:hypothetical protein